MGETLGCGCVCPCAFTWKIGTESAVAFQYEQKKRLKAKDREPPAMDLFIESVGDAFNNNLVSASQANVNINTIGTGVGSDSELAIKRDAYALTASNLLTDSNIIGDVSTRHALQQAFGAAGGGKYGTNTVSGVDIQELREWKRAVGGKASFSTFANHSTSTPTPSVTRAHCASVSDLFHMTTRLEAILLISMQQDPVHHLLLLSTILTPCLVSVAMI
jgi:hypothetical protein